MQSAYSPPAEPPRSRPRTPRVAVRCLAATLAVLPAVVAPAPAQPAGGPGSVLERRALGRSSVADIDRASARLYARASPPRARYAVERYRLRLTSTDERGRPLEVLARLYVPSLEAGSRPPVYLFAAGTTGLADACAPSLERPRERNWGDYEAHMLSYAAQGFVGIAPDYAGFQDGAPLQPYFVAASEGRVLLDAARSVYRLAAQPASRLTPGPAVFMAGYSQGGHAVFAAADLAGKYAPEVPLRGVIGYGSTTDVGALLRENPYLAPYLVTAYAAYYGRERVDPARVLQDRWLPGLKDLESGVCVDAVGRRYPNDPAAVYRPDFARALYGFRLGAAFPGLAAAVARNATGLAANGARVPALIIQGMADPIVGPPTQAAFVRRTCALGRRVTYSTYPGVHHFQTRQVGFSEAVTWMRTLAAGGRPGSSCAR